MDILWKSKTMAFIDGFLTGSLIAGYAVWIVKREIKTYKSIYKEN